MSPPTAPASAHRLPRLVRQISDRRPVPVLVGAVWVALFLNTLTFASGALVVPIPRPVGQLVTQGALALALLLALLANRWALVRPSMFLSLYTLLGVLALMVSVHNEFHFGSTFRAVRLLAFVAVLWLLTPWFGRRDMVLLRCHRLCLIAVLGVVAAGAVVAPGAAFSYDGRLSGVLWPIPPTQVAHYAAVLLGTTAVLWACRVISGRQAVLTVLASGAILFATHTRTALAAMVIALLVSGCSLFLGHVRVRRTTAWMAALGLVGVTIFASQLSAWLLRGQSSAEVGDLTGRTKVWSEVFAMARPRLADLFGSGMSNMSFDGLPIDSNWVATYLDQGWVGIAIEVLALLGLLVLAVSRAAGPHRGVALFLIVYCLVASFTEVGLSSPSPYVLDLVVAAALLAAPIRRRLS